MRATGELILAIGTGVDWIIAQTSGFWDFVRGLNMTLSVVLVGLLGIVAWRNRKSRSRVGNVFMIAIIALAAQSALTSLARLGGPVSYRLVVSTAFLALAVGCLLEPSRRRDRHRLPNDLL